jgi:hypothetical protein
MAEVYNAAPTRAKVVPAFSVQKIDGEHEVTVATMERISDRPDKNGNFKHRLAYKTEKRPNGYLVTFPAGHSIHIATYEKLKALGYTRTEIPIVDEDGEAVTAVPNVIKPSKKELTANA